MQRCMQEDFHGNLEMVNLKNNKIFLDEFASLIRDSLSQSIFRLGERTNLFQSLSFLYCSIKLSQRLVLRHSISAIY